MNSDNEYNEYYEYYDYNEYYEYISDSDISESEYENNKISEYENDIKQDDFEYEEFIFIINTINDFRRYNNPLILDELTTNNLIQFLTNCDT